MEFLGNEWGEDLSSMWPPRLPDLTLLVSVPCESDLVKATKAQIHEHDYVNAFRISTRIVGHSPIYNIYNS
jgi:hypothetical protein